MKAFYSLRCAVVAGCRANQLLRHADCLRLHDRMSGYITDDRVLSMACTL